MAGVGLRSGDSTPICRCRVLYLGSAVPHVTKDGLQGIQEPLRELYPEQGAVGARGIDSWLSVWSNGLLLENVDENHKKITRFFPIDTLHYCAAVRYVSIPEKSSSGSSQPRFLPLDSPFARSPNPSHPPLFASILRRTTGIKVLECHTFICKREIAANALVRCCFHAYADSAYARHIDSGGGSSSVYGTLRNYTQPSPTPPLPPAPPVSASGVEKVERWNRNISGGSMSTLDQGNQGPLDNTDNATTVDDISIYNGDENHKIWAGSTRDISSVERDYIYGGDTAGGSNTICSRRSARTRPRQSVNVPPPPPPPPNEEKKKIGKENTKRKKKKNWTRGKEEPFPLMNGSGSVSLSLMNGMGMGMQMGMRRSHSSMSGGATTLMKGATLAHPGHTIYSQPHPPPPPSVIMVPHPRMVGGTFQSHHHKPNIIVPVRPHMMPTNLIPVPLPPHPMYLQAGKKPPRHYQMAMEEPIYMPSTRPLSPVASYQPNHFPHEAYLMQQYATLDVHSKKKEKQEKRMNGHQTSDEDPNVSPFSTQGYRKKGKESKKSKSKSQSPFLNGEIHDDESPFNSYIYRKKVKEMKNGRKTSSEEQQQQEDGEGEDGDSPFNTGIYRRKGHLNERAFSYSIRQEHRSRSYGSLANLKFAPPPIISNGTSTSNKQAHHNGSTDEIKKEREIVQMMQDLDLSGDELERCEVPMAVYQHQHHHHHRIHQHPSKVRR